MQKIIEQIKNLIETSEKLSGAYFWTSPTSAGARRSMEKRYSIPEFRWHENGNEYSAEFTVTCSCSNVYVRGAYKKNGKKTTLTAIKNSYKRLIAA